jgi:uncharacterized protein DUF6152
LEAIDMKRNVMIHLATAISLFTASSVFAHHSHGLFYDPCKKVTIEGRVESAQWKNPHVLIVVKMADGTNYTAELTSLQGLTNQGVVGPAQAALTVGARVVVLGNPLRDSAQIRASFPNIADISNTKIVDVIQIRRMDDSWSWAQTPPECK